MQHIVPVRGFQSEVPFPHPQWCSRVLMYMRMGTEPRGTPKVRAPAGLRCPYAHTSDTPAHTMRFGIP